MASAFRDRMLAATRLAYDQQRALQEEISQLYVQCAENLGRVADRYGDDSLTGRQAIVLRKSMQRYTRQMWSEVESKTRAAAYASAGIGIEAQASMLDDALHGIGITGKPSFMSVFGRTKDEAVASVLNGHIYAGKRAGLSKRIWNNEAMLNGQLESILSTAVAEGRSATQLARDLEAYVNPEAMMPDHWNDIYPMPFSYAVDYNAKRLAVTTLNHAYYQGTIMAARENPFAEFLHWELSSFHLIYDVCDTYMEHDEGLGLGNFSLDNAPLPHPFCRCTWYIDSSKSLDEIGQELGDWLAGAENPKLEKAFGEWKTNQNVLIISPESVRMKSDDEIRRFIQTGRFDLTINRGQQLKHYPGTHEYEQYIQARQSKGEYAPSRLTIPIDELQDIIQKKAGAGTKNLHRDRHGAWLMCEQVDCGKIVGTVVNNRTGQEADTTMIKIHYGNKGVHAVPDYPIRKEGN